MYSFVKLIANPHSLLANWYTFWRILSKKILKSIKQLYLICNYRLMFDRLFILKSHVRKCKLDSYSIIYKIDQLAKLWDIAFTEYEYTCKLSTMATSQYRNNSTFDIISTGEVMITSTVWLSFYTIVQTYIAPVLIVNALVSNSFIILLTLTPNAFSKHTSFTVCAFYASFAIADLITVIVANLFIWIGVPRFLLIHVSILYEVRVYCLPLSYSWLEPSITLSTFLSWKSGRGLKLHINCKIC